MKKLFLIIVFLFLYNLNAKELMDKNVLLKYMNNDNPYIFTIKANKDIQNANIIYSKGSFDTTIGFKNDNKDYPLSNSNFTNIYMEKQLESGAELSLSYRKSNGFQEYNNIKTGENGEINLGVNIPVFQLLKGTNKNKLNLTLNEIEGEKISLSIIKNLRDFYITVFNSYQQLIYRNQLYLLEQDLYDNAKKRNLYIEKKVSVGDTAPVILIESLQVIKEREQRLEDSLNNLNNSRKQLSILLGISDEDILNKYEIPIINEEQLAINLLINEELSKAINQRPELKILDLDNMKINEESKFNETLKYPEIDLSINGVHDNHYNENGLKVSMNMKFPIERNKYQGKHSELIIKQNKNSNESRKSILEIERVITILINNLNTLNKNIDSVLNEITLAEQIEKAAKKQFELGQENLFILNQRELKTLQVKIKKQEYIFKKTLILLEIDKETGVLDNLFNNI